MAKELVISSDRHETKVAVLEDDQLVEIYFQRANEYSLAGSIHKGRVTRVLPGMQSAFVDIGLERDAFLYVSDFYEEQEEYDKMPMAADARGRRGQREMPAAAPRGAAAPVVA
ncbi:MAG: Rne/Rng family ribonuclease, partial [Bryobacteraceae bacterium]